MDEIVTFIPKTNYPFCVVMCNYVNCYRIRVEMPENHVSYYIIMFISCLFLIWLYR